MAGPSRARGAVGFFAGVYVVLLAYATLTPADTAESVTGVVAVIAASVSAAIGGDLDATYAVLESAANVALFVPLGALVATPLRRTRGVAIVAAASVGASTSLAIEFAQRYIDGRYSTMADVAANSGGAILGGTVIVTVVATTAGRGRVTTPRDA
ncbi:MAG TPA: VanZ family protein [Microcella sp.]|nr:VanZ family protein [Microcella sp.]